MASTGSTQGMTLRISPPASAISSTQPNASPGAAAAGGDGDLAFLRLTAIGQHQRQGFYRAGPAPLRPSYR